MSGVGDVGVVVKRGGAMTCGKGGDVVCIGSVSKVVCAVEVITSSCGRGCASVCDCEVVVSKCV